ncbi:MAG: lycopene cyclase family protein, partial [Pseudobdellovibrio sp.]
SEAQLNFLKKLNLFSWSQHSVFFKNSRHISDNPYHSLAGINLENFLLKQLQPSQILLDAKSQIDSVNKKINLPEGSVGYDLLIDARGAVYPASQIAGYQKFVGLEIDFSGAHGLKNPILIDAQVPQTDGFRFFYCLPLSETRMLIEDTRYSTVPQVNESEYIEQIKLYAERKFSNHFKIERTETGILPLTKSKTDLVSDRNLITVGTRAGLFHPVTGYSIPFAVKTSDFIAQQLQKNSAGISEAYYQFHSDIQKQLSLFFKLNFVMFSVASDEERIKLFEHCYTRPDFIVRRFYQGRMSIFEKFLFFIAKPPVSVSKLIKLWYNKRHEKAA